MMNRRVGDLLTNRRVVTLPPTATARDAAIQMKAAHVASVVVVPPGDEPLLGIFTERDLTERVVADGLDPAKTTLDAVMTPHPITVALDTRVGDALRIMHLNGLRHLPVTRDGLAIGIVSMRDFMGTEIAGLEREKELMDSLTEVI